MWNALRWCVFAPTMRSGAARIKPGCSWWDSMDGTWVFLQTSLCARLICVHPEASLEKTTQQWVQNGKIPHPHPPFPSACAAGSWGQTHSSHLWGCCHFVQRVEKQVQWHGMMHCQRDLLGSLPSPRHYPSHLPPPLGHRTLHLISLHTIYHLWARL